MKNKNYQRGFTFIELLVVSIAIIAVSVVTGSILTSALRGTNKANTINSIRQNGNYALIQMGKAIQYAKSFDGVSTDDTTYVTNCIVPTPTPTPIQYKYIKVTSFDNTQTTFACLPPSSPTNIASNSANLLDTNVVTLSSCFFTCTQSKISEMPVIGIQFTLSQKSSSGLFENKATIPFQATVIMRNIGK